MPASHSLYVYLQDRKPPVITSYEIIGGYESRSGLPNLMVAPEPDNPVKLLFEVDEHQAVVIWGGALTRKAQAAFDLAAEGEPFQVGRKKLRRLTHAEIDQLLSCRGENLAWPLTFPGTGHLDQWRPNGDTPVVTRDGPQIGTAAGLGLLVEPEPEMDAARPERPRV